MCTSCIYCICTVCVSTCSYLHIEKYYPASLFTSLLSLYLFPHFSHVKDIPCSGVYTVKSVRTCCRWVVSSAFPGSVLKRSQTAVGGLWAAATWQEWSMKVSGAEQRSRLLLAPVPLMSPPTRGKALSRNHARPLPVPSQPLSFHLKPSLCLTWRFLKITVGRVKAHKNPTWI